MDIKKILLLIFVSFSFLGFSQKPKDQISSHDKNEYFKLIYQRCPTADILQIESKEDYIEIEYLCEGRYYEIGINNSQVIFLETKADKSMVPFDDIKRKLEKKYEGWLLDEISIITTSDTSFLKVEIIKDGIEQNLFFTTDGKWYKSQSIVASDKWTIDKLSKSAIYQKTDYHLLSPDSIYYLPEILREVSGITISADSKTIFCVQDEMGAVFEYDILSGEVKNIHRFTDIGDFEGIALKDSLLYVLRSDGNIFYFNPENKKEIKQFMLSINALNFESLTYDELKKEFLIVSKDAMLNTPESKRFVHKFTFKNANNATQFIEVDILKINELITNNLVETESNDILFNPSAIAIHPISREIYILSASDRILTVCDNKGLKSVFPLPAELYYKPEGLTFFKNGDLLISSEGDKRGIVKGSILFFKYQK